MSCRSSGRKSDEVVVLQQVSGRQKVGRTEVAEDELVGLLVRKEAARKTDSFSTGRCSTDSRPASGPANLLLRSEGWAIPKPVRRIVIHPNGRLFDRPDELQSAGADTAGPKLTRSHIAGPQSCCSTSIRTR